jgi:uncharacterized protein
MASRTCLPDAVELEIPGLPDALEGLRILHLSDLHVRAPRRRHQAILTAIEQAPCDLLALTGDAMVVAGDEPAAAEFIMHVTRAADARLGVVGVWGNHDSPELRRRLRSVPVRWLKDSAWLPPDVPLSILGVHCGHDEHRGLTGDLAGALLDEAAHRPDDRPRFRLLLTHMPIWLPAAASAGIDLMLCGHTHAGQCRLPTGHILYNATPRWPLSMSAGLVRWGQTQCLISRGLGEVYVTGLRLFCRPQMPLITLRKRRPGGVDAGSPETVTLQ